MLQVRSKPAFSQKTQEQRNAQPASSFVQQLANQSPQVNQAKNVQTQISNSPRMQQAVQAKPVVQASFDKPQALLRPRAGKVNTLQTVTDQQTQKREWQVKKATLAGQNVSVKRDSVKLGPDGKTYVKVTLANTSTLMIGTEFLAGKEVEVAGKLDAEDRQFSITLSAYFGGVGDFTGHVFVGVEQDDGTLKWMGFVPEGGLEADSKEDMADHEGASYTSAIDDDTNKAHSRKTVHKKVAVSKDKRDTFEQDFEAEGGTTDYIWKSSDCIAVAEQVLASAGITSLSDTINGEVSASKFAIDSKADYVNKMKSKEWTTVDGGGKRMLVTYDFAEDLLLMGAAKDDFQVVHETDFLQLMVQDIESKTTGANAGKNSFLAFIILGGLPKNAFLKGRSKTKVTKLYSAFPYNKIKTS